MCKCKRLSIHVLNSSIEEREKEKTRAKARIANKTRNSKVIKSPKLYDEKTRSNKSINLI